MSPSKPTGKFTRADIGKTFTIVTNTPDALHPGDTMKRVRHKMKLTAVMGYGFAFQQQMEFGREHIYTDEQIETAIEEGA